MNVWRLCRPPACVPLVLRDQNRLKAAALARAAIALLLSLSGFAAADPSSDSVPDVFRDECLVCHGAAADDDLLYPSLLRIARERTPVEMVEVILNGKFDRAGEQNGQVVPVMPAHDRLANETIVSVVNYLIEAAGATGEPIDIETVAAIRGERAQEVFLNDLEYDQASQIYFTHCAGCHAVDRSGSAGSALYQWAMNQAGTQAIKQSIHFGTSWGMPDWGMSEKLSDVEISLVARYLQLPQRELPRFDQHAALASWRNLKGLEQRLPEPEPGSAALVTNLFVSVLHDTGQLMLIDGDTKAVLGLVDLFSAPSMVQRSPDGRYLYAMSRSADIALVDLAPRIAEVVARVKVGFEGRSLAVSNSNRFNTIAAAGYWPPQVAVLDRLTLKPEWVQLLDEKAYANNETHAAVSQIVSTPQTDSYLAVTKRQGHIVSLDRAHGVKRRSTGPPFLRSGSWDVSGRYLLVPADDEKIAVFDTVNNHIAAVLDVPGLVGGVSGIAFVDPMGTQIWATSGMGSPSFVRIATGKPSDKGLAVETTTKQGGGTLSMDTHPASPHIWLDFPLSEVSEYSSSVGVVDKGDRTNSIQLLPVAAWAGLEGETFARTVHPQFDTSGSEVWVTVWNRQDGSSAIVVIDDATLEAKAVIKDPRLVTPIRTFHLGIASKDTGYRVARSRKTR